MNKWIVYTALVLLAAGASASFLPATILFALLAWGFFGIMAFATIWSFVDEEEFIERMGPPKQRTPGLKITLMGIDVGIWLMLGMTGHWFLATLWAANFFLALIVEARQKSLSKTVV